jgi:acyl carrier protein
MTMRPGAPAAGGGPPTREEVQALVVAQLAAVLLLPPQRISAGSHLAADLHADSLDLVEVVERVERALAERGWNVRVPEAALASWHTVGDVTEGTHAVLREVAQAP